MSANEISRILGISRKTAGRYRARKDWPDTETRESIINWARERDAWDEVTQTYTGKYRENDDTCAKGTHPWVEKNIYTQPSTGARRCRLCITVGQARRRANVSV